MHLYSYRLTIICLSVPPSISARKGTIRGVLGTAATIGCTIMTVGIPPVNSSMIMWSVVGNSSWSVNLPRVALSSDRSTLTLSNVQKGDDVIYQCSVMSSAGLSSWDNIVLIFEGNVRTPKTQPCPGLPRVKEPKATRRVQMYHCPDLCHRTGGQDTPGYIVHD